MAKKKKKKDKVKPVKRVLINTTQFAAAGDNREHAAFTAFNSPEAVLGYCDPVGDDEESVTVQVAEYEYIGLRTIKATVARTIEMK